MESGTNTTPEFVFTSKTLVERKLVQSTAIYSAVFYCLILLFMYGVFLNDLQLKWYYDTRAGRFDEIPRMSEPVKMREQLKNVACDAPAMYYYLYRHWLHFLIGIPFATIIVGVILSFYRSATIALLLLYHFVFAMFTLNLVFLAILAVIISNTPLIIRGL